MGGTCRAGRKLVLLLFALFLGNLFRVCFLQKHRLVKVTLHALEGICEVVAAADSLVHDDSERNAGLEDHSVLGLERNLSGISHGEEDTGCPEFVDVVIDVICSQAGQVGDGEGSVERAGIDDL